MIVLSIDPGFELGWAVIDFEADIKGKKYYEEVKDKLLYRIKSIHGVKSAKLKLVSYSYTKSYTKAEFILNIDNKKEKINKKILKEELEQFGTINNIVDKNNFLIFSLKNKSFKKINKIIETGMYCCKKEENKYRALSKYIEQLCKKFSINYVVCEMPFYKNLYTITGAIKGGVLENITVVEDLHPNTIRTILLGKNYKDKSILNNYIKINYSDSKDKTLHELDAIAVGLAFIKNFSI